MDSICKPVLQIFLCATVFRLSSGAKIVSICPSSGYADGVSDEVICQLDRPFFATSCGLPPTQVKFTFISSLGVPSIYCVTDFSPLPSTGTPDATSCPSCSCLSDATGSEYTLTFTPNRTIHYNGSFKCEATCLAGGQTENHTLCAPIPWRDVPGPYCRDCERPLCPPEWVSAPIIFGLFRLFAILYFVLYVLFAAYKSLWPFSGILAWWVILLMCLATAFFPECVVLCIIDAILWRPCCCLDCISVPWRITLLVLAVVICLASIIYLIVAGIVHLWPFPEISIEECPDFKCFHEGWQIFLFVVSCIGIAILICFFIAFWCKRPQPRGPEPLPKPLPQPPTQPPRPPETNIPQPQPPQPPPNPGDEGLLVECGECHKWCCFTVTLEGHTLQDIFIRPNLDNIFKKCANHDEEEFSLREVEKMIQKLLKKRRMGDIRNVTLVQTICLKDHASKKWYKQDHDPDKAVLDVMKGTSRWSEGAGTAVNPEELKDVLQIRLYLQSNSNPYANQ